MSARRLPPTLALNPWARRLAEHRASGRALLDLTEANPTRVGLSGLTPELLASLADPGGTRYEPAPRGLAEARQAVADYCAARGTPASPDDVILTAGTSESYAHLFRLLAEPGETVLLPAPSYPLCEPIAALEGVETIPYRLAWDGAWHLDLGSVEEALERAGGRARALVLVEPNHPTGSCLTPGEIETLEALLARHEVALISDEVFGDFPWPPRRDALPGLLGERAVPTFVLGGLSKTCGMPQLKLGWVVAAGPQAARRGLLERLEWIADLFLSVASPVQLALPRLLEARHPYQARVRERLAANLATLADLVRDHPQASLWTARAGWAAALRLPAHREAEWALALLEHDVAVHSGHFYDFESDDLVVVSLIAEAATFARGIARLGEVLAAG